MNSFFTTGRLKWITVYLLLTLAILLFCLNLLSANAAPNQPVSPTPTPTTVIRHKKTPIVTPELTPTTPGTPGGTPTDTITPIVTPTSTPIPIPTLPPIPTKPKG